MEIPRKREVRLLLNMMPAIATGGCSKLMTKLPMLLRTAMQRQMITPPLAS
jgi:hypothetical protein